MISCAVSLNAALAVDQDDCEHPPALSQEDEDGSMTVRTKCFRCGQPACKACSWIDFDPTQSRKTRRCRDCRTQDGERW